MRTFSGKIIGATIILGVTFLVSGCTSISGLDLRKEKDMETVDKALKPLCEGLQVKSITLSPTDSKSFTFNVNNADVRFVNPDDTTKYKTNTISLPKGEIIGVHEDKLSYNPVKLGHQLPADFSFTAVSKAVNATVAQTQLKGISVDGVKCSIDLGVKNINDAVIEVTAQHQKGSETNGRMVTVYYSEVHAKATLAGEIISIDFSEFESDEE